MKRTKTVLAAITGDKKVFYGWWIVLSGTVAAILNGGTYMYGFSTFFIPLTETFGWSRAQLSGAFSLSRLEGGLLGPLEGYLVDRFGTRKFLVLGFVLSGLGYILMSQMRSLLMFYLIFLVCLALGSGFIAVPTSTAIGNWFIRRRSRAMGFYMAGTALGGMLTPVLAWLIGQFGWRSAAVVVGAVVMGVGIPLSSVTRHKPEPFGYLPDGDTIVLSSNPSSVVAAEDSTQRTTRLSDEVDFEPAQALKTPAFWLLGIAFALRFMVVSSIALHLIPFATDIGLSPQTAAFVLASLAALGFVGRISVGWIGDIFNKRYVLAACQAITAVALVILATANSLWQMVLFLVLYGPVYGGGAPMVPALRGEFFGRKSFATIGGLMQILFTLGTVSGPLFAGWAFDVFGSYRRAFLVFCAASLISIPLLLAAKRPHLTHSTPGVARR